MKKPFLLSALAFATVFTACNKDKITALANVSFSTSFSETMELPVNSGSNVDLPLTPGTSLQLPGFEYRFATNIDQIAKDRNTSADKLISVKIDSMFLSAAAPAGMNLNFIDSLKVYITADSMPEMLAAKKVPVPKGLTTSYMDVTDQNLKDYFKRDSIGLRVDGWVNALPRQGTSLKFGNVFRIVGNPLK